MDKIDRVDKIDRAKKEELIQIKMRELHEKDCIEQYKAIEKEIELEARLRLDTVKLENAIKLKDKQALRTLAGNCFCIIPCWIDYEDCYKCMTSGSPIQEIKQKARDAYIDCL